MFYLRSLTRCCYLEIGRRVQMIGREDIVVDVLTGHT